jgi:urease gamma subunit
MSMEIIIGIGAIAGTGILSYIFVKKGLKGKVLEVVEKVEKFITDAEKDGGDFEPVLTVAKNFVVTSRQAIEDGKLTYFEVRSIVKSGGELITIIGPYFKK